MQMEGIDLLLGNDFLKQFGKLHIDYQDSQTLITVGELPSNLIIPKKPDPGKSVKIQTTEGLNIPAFSVRQVPISQPFQFEHTTFYSFSEANDTKVSYSGTRLVVWLDHNSSNCKYVVPRRLVGQRYHSGEKPNLHR